MKNQPTNLTCLTDDELRALKVQDDDRAARIVANIYKSTHRGEADDRVSLWDEYDRRGMEWDA